MAGTTGLEPAASAVTGQRSNQLNYVPTRQINKMRNRQCLCGAAQVALRQCTTYETERSVKHNYPNSFSENAKVRLDNGARRSCQTCSHHLFARVCYSRGSAAP